MFWQVVLLSSNDYKYLWLLFPFSSSLSSLQFPQRGRHKWNTVPNALGLLEWASSTGCSSTHHCVLIPYHRFVTSKAMQSIDMKSCHCSGLQSSENINDEYQYIARPKRVWKSFFLKAISSKRKEMAKKQAVREQKIVQWHLANVSWSDRTTSPSHCENHVSTEWELLQCGPRHCSIISGRPLFRLRDQTSWIVNWLTIDTMR